MMRNVGSLLLVVAVISAAPSVAAESRPNVLFIVSDDLNCFLGCYGDPLAKTPNIDRLAARGVRFERAYCAFPLCGPSRNSFLTGLYPNATGIHDNGQVFRQSIPAQPSMPQAFRLAGYFAARVGKLFHYNVPMSVGTNGHDDPGSWELELNPAGVDRLEEEPRIVSLRPGEFGGTLSWYASPEGDRKHTDGMLADDAAWVLERCARDRSRPFFLAVGFFRPHTPYVAPKTPYFDMYPEDRMPLPTGVEEDQRDVPKAALASRKSEQDAMSDQQRRQARQAYYASISFLDAQVGRVLDAVDRLGLADDTIVVFTSDHGYHMGEHGLYQKMSLFEESARVPLVIATPGKCRAGGVAASPVAHVDIFPTLASLCGVEPPANLQGQSLVPLLADPQATGRGWAVTQVHRQRSAGRAAAKPDGAAPPHRFFGYSLRTQRWRYTEWDEGREGRELYDHDADPQELTNLAEVPEHAATVKELSQQLTVAVRQSLPPSGTVPDVRPTVWNPTLARPGGAVAAQAADLLARGLEGWVVEGDRDFEDRGKKVPVWTFENGVVRCSGRGFGYLRHADTVADFRLELEYRFPKHGNSGVGIRTVPFTGPLETRPSQAAYEIQLLSDAGKTPDRGACCSLYGHEAPTENTSRPVGEWNTIVVECRGPRIRIEHNGVKVIDFDQSTRKDTATKPLSGSVCLQNHGSVVEFRNVRLVNLAPPAEPPKQPAAAAEKTDEVRAKTGAAVAPVEPQFVVARVEKMPRLPKPLHVIDWRETARRYYAVAFDARAEGPGLPAVTLAADRKSFGFDPYLAPDRKRDARGEAHACVAGVTGASLVGLDMTRLHGVDWVTPTSEWFDTQTGIWSNRPGSGRAIGHVVYEYWPLVLGTLLADAHPERQELQAAVVRQADTLVAMAKALGHPGRLDLEQDYRFEDGRWQVRPRRIDSNRGNAAALAWALYAAHVRRPASDYLAVAKEAVAWWLLNPGRYEVTHQPGPLVAARLNAEHGCEFDIERLLTIWFGDYEAYVPMLPAYQVMPWGVTAGSEFNGATCDGLDGARMRHQPANGFYTFAMGSYQGPGWLLPAVRYDQRLARAVARYCLHAANSCRYFLGIDLDWDHQDHKDWRDARPDGTGYLFSYEGLRWEPLWGTGDRAFRPYATGDVVALFSKRYSRANAQSYWTDKSDFASRPDNIAIYMGNNIGFLGAVYRATDVPGIIAWDLNATDHFAPASYPTRLLHNPHAEAKRVVLDVGVETCDVYDTVGRAFVRRDVAGPQAFTLAPDQAAVLVFVPAGGRTRRDGPRLLVDDIVIDYRGSLTAKPTSDAPRPN